VQYLYERLADLLGKPENDPVFDRLLDDLGSRPNLDHEDENMRFWQFSDLGFGMMFDKRRGCFSVLIVELATAAVEAGNVKQYSGNLPSGIVPSDRREEVQMKLRMEPTTSNLIAGLTPKDRCDEYDIGDCRLSFTFNGLTEQLWMLTVSYKGLSAVCPEVQHAGPTT
jgi:hypothetical protein